MIAISAWSQNQNTGIYLSWDNSNACQIWNDSDREAIFVEEFEDSQCLLVCQSSLSNFELTNVPMNVNISWTISGGIVLTQNNNQIQILWDDEFNGGVTVEYSINNVFYSNTLCIEKTAKPVAKFTINNDLSVDITSITACISQDINFTNLSNTNNGSDIISYLWDFGDGNFSYIETPHHYYVNPGEYDVTLSVTNACGCFDSIRGKVRVLNARNYEINCATVVCEGSRETYSLSIDAMQNCTGFNWQAEGGTIINQAGGNVLIEWNHVDEDGFGFVTFNPVNCTLECNEPTTIKVPVIQSNATIQGNNLICTGKQSKYSLPQWPTTDIQWSVVNPNGIDFQLIQTDQRNEIIFSPISGTGTITLRAIYNNTLLNCGGIAEISINVKEQLKIETTLEKICQNNMVEFTNIANQTVNWLITKDNTVIHSENTINLLYTFNDSGSYIIQASHPDFCESNNLVLQVNESPLIPFAILGDNLVCPFMSIRYEVQNPNPDYFYEWTVTNGIILGNNFNNYINIEFNNFPATVSVRSLNPSTGCYSDVIFLTIEADTPIVDILSDNSEICGSSVSIFQAVIPTTTTLFNNADTYQWSLSNASLGSISSGQGTNMAEITWNNVTVNTTVDVILTVTKCSLPPTQITFSVLIKSIPEIQWASLPTTSFCSNETFQVNIQAVDPSINLANHNVIVRWFVDGQERIGGISEFFSLINNSDEEVLRGVTAQIISYDGCTGLSNTINFSATIIPSPPAVISTAGDKRFCEASDIDSVLIASSNLIQVTYQWGTFQNTIFTPILGATTNTFNPTDFGIYACNITSTNELSGGGCSRLSNSLTISQKDCNTNPTVCSVPGLMAVNNSFYSDCGTITLSGTSTLADSESWLVYGPGNEVVNLVNSTVTGPPGIYTIVYVARAYCPITDAYDLVESVVDVLIPFEPVISYDFACTGSEFTLFFILNNSTFYPLLQNPVETVQMLVNGTWQTLLTSGSVDISGNPQNIVQLRVINTGSFNGQNYECIQHYDITTFGVPDNQISVFSNELCHNTPFSFGFFNPIDESLYSFEWTFEPGITNSLFNPSRVFNSPGTYPVQVEITNTLGCSRTITTAVVVPEPCFAGVLQTTPNDAHVCEGESVTISYISSLENCAPTYLWRRGNTLLTEFMNQSSIDVTEPGYYWLEIVSPQGCLYEVPNRVYPKFNTLPALKIFNESQYCEGENIQISAISSGTIEWFLEGISVHQGEIWNPTLSAGTYNIIVVATGNLGCATTESFVLTVTPSPTNVTITGVVMRCEPYTIELTASADQPADFLWSNGQVGESIIVNHGGAYQVIAYNGACSIEASINLPKHPEVYAWSYPQGCLNYCLDYNPYVLGPLAAIESNTWMLTGAIFQTSNDPSPIFQLPVDGSYNAILTNGGCTYKAPPLNYQIDRCEECKLTVRNSRIDNNDTNYCSFAAQFLIINETTQIIEIQLINPENLVTFSPSTFQLYPGPNTINTTILPINGYTGNSFITILINGTTYDKDFNPVPCAFHYRVFMPRCKYFPRPDLREKEDQSSLLNKIHFSPNPVKTEATLKWDLNYPVDNYQLFDLQGQLLLEKKITSKNFRNHYNYGTSTTRYLFTKVMVKKRVNNLF